MEDFTTDLKFTTKSNSINVEAIPQEMKERVQWVLWKSEKRNGKPTKVPYQITGHKVNVTNPNTWNSFERVYETLQNQPNLYNGLGYVFSEEDPYVGVDQDDCIDENGTISHEARENINNLASYTERSQSGKGTHTIVKAHIPGPRNRKGRYEMYEKNRFFCFTGHHIEGIPTTIEENQDGLNKVYKRVFQPDKKSSKVSSKITVPLSDEEVIEKARTGKNRPKFQDLYQGNWEGYFSSQSEADQSLCNLLVHYTKDVEQIDRIFKGSGLYRDKWDRDDYSTNTIQNAIAFVESSSQSERKSQAEMLLQLIEASEIEVFHDSTSETFIRIPVNEHVETWPTKSKTVKLWLSGQFYKATGKSIGSDALGQVLGVLESRAIFDGPKIDLALRVADRDGASWYDLANGDWQAIRIVPGRWEIVDKPPALFFRGANTSAQVIPERVGVKEVFKVLDFINLADDGQKLLFIVELVSCLVASIPHALSIWHGEKGAAKSTAMRIRRKLIDPANQELQLMPKSTTELALTLYKNWMPSFDNLDGISGQVSDILCVAATGGGISKRELYTDSDEIILNFRRCVSLNGVNEPATRPDLLDRAILFELQRIPENERKSESEFWQSFEEVRPRIIGAMFQVLANAMQIYPGVVLDRLPRMADFAKWGYAIGEALYQGGGKKFLDAFEANRLVANNEALTANPVALAIVGFMNSKQTWTGTAGSLLIALLQITGELGIDTGARSWPRSAKALAKRLKQVRSNLIEAGISLTETHDSHSKQTIYSLALVELPPSSEAISQVDEESC
jgi:hypothetical protein